MASFNRVILVGNLTRDVELRYTQQGGTAVTEIGLAVNDRVKRNDEWVDETTFVDITLWGRTAEVANEYLSKGSPVLIEGRLKLDSWDDKNDGKKRYKLRVVGEKMQMLGTRQGGGNGGSGQGGNASYSQAGQSSSQGDGSESGQSGSPSEPPAPPRDNIPF